MITSVVGDPSAIFGALSTIPDRHGLHLWEMLDVFYGSVIQWGIYQCDEMSTGLDDQ